MTRFIRIPLTCALLVVILGASGLSFAQNPTGQSDPQGYVENLIGDLISSDGQKVNVFGLSVGITGNVVAERVTVSDVDGVWLEIDGFSLDWQPFSLFQDILRVNSLDIELLTVNRWPSKPETPSTTDPPAPRPVEIGRLGVSKIVLTDGLVGEQAEFSAQAQASITNDPVRVSVDAKIERTDSIAGEFAAKIHFEPETEQLSIDIRGSDGPAGLVSNLLKVPGRPKLELALTGSGPLDRWDGEISLNTGPAQTIDGEIRIVAVDEGRRIGAALRGSVSQFLPASIRPGFVGRSTLAGSVLIPVDGTPLEIETLFLETSATKLDISGTVDPGGTRTNLRLAARTPAAQTRLAVLPGEDRHLSAADLQIQATFSGALDNPQWSVIGSAASIVAGADTITGLQIAGASEPSDGDDSGFALNASASVDTGRNVAWADAFRGPMEFAVSGVYGSNAPLNLRAISLATPAGRIQLSGSLQPFAGTFDLSIDATSTDLKVGNTLLDGLLAGVATVTGRISRTGAADPANLTSVRLATAAVDVMLDGEVDGDSINLTVDGLFTDLSRISGRAAGRARFGAALSGPMTEISVSLNAQGDELVLSGKPFDAAVLKFDGTLSSDSPTGKFSLSGRYQGAPVNAGFDLLSRADRSRVFSNLVLTMAGVDLSGEIALPPNHRPTGRFVFNAPELTALGDLLLIDLMGSLKGSVVIAGDNATDQVVMVATGSNIRMQDFSISSLDADLTVPDIRRPSQIVGKITAAGVKRDEIAFESLIIEGAMRGNALAAKFNATGDPINGSASALISPQPNGTLVTLERAEMNIYGVPVELVQPARMVFAKKGIVVDASVSGRRLRHDRSQRYVQRQCRYAFGCP